MTSRKGTIVVSIWLLSCSSIGFVVRSWNLKQYVLSSQDFVHVAEKTTQTSDSEQVVVSKIMSSATSTEDQKGRHQHARHTSPDGGKCISMHSWHEQSYPNCNLVHELRFISALRDGDVEYIARGGINNVFHYSNPPLNESLALKILMYRSNQEYEYTYHDLKSVRHDSIVMERLTKSPYIFDLYGYCGFTLILPFVTGGTLDGRLKELHGKLQPENQNNTNQSNRTVDSMTQLQYAVEIAKGLRDLHDIDEDGVPSATHGDLNELQYLIKDGKLMLGDFNKGEFLSKSSKTGRPCTYKPPYTNRLYQKAFRSPEEYSNMQQTAATDVYALGSLLYYILTGNPVWEQYLKRKYRKKLHQWVKDGKRPEIDSKIVNSKDPSIVAIKTAYEMCTRYDPAERATAKNVSDYLEGVWQELVEDGA